MCGVYFKSKTILYDPNRPSYFLFFLFQKEIYFKINGSRLSINPANVHLSSSSILVLLFAEKENLHHQRHQLLSSSSAFSFSCDSGNGRVTNFFRQHSQTVAACGPSETLLGFMLSCFAIRKIALQFSFNLIYF